MKVKKIGKNKKQERLNMIVKAQKTAAILEVVAPTPPADIAQRATAHIMYPDFPAFTEMVVYKLETAFSYGCNVVEACAHADISRAYFYEFITAHTDMADKFERLRQKPMLSARQSLVKSFSLYPALALRYLEDKDPEMNPKKTVKIEGDVTVNFAEELKERTKKYEPRIIDAVAKVSASDMGGVEGGS